MKSLVNDYTYMIQATEFIDLRYRIQEVYQNFMQGFDWDLPKVHTCEWVSTRQPLINYSLIYCGTFIQTILSVRMIYAVG